MRTMKSVPNSHSEELLLAIGAVAGVMIISVWVAGGLAMLFSRHGWHEVPLSGSPALMLGILKHPRDIRLAWPAKYRNLLGPTFSLYCFVLLVLMSAFALILYSKSALVKKKKGASATLLKRSKAFGLPKSTKDNHAATWATRGEIKNLVVGKNISGRLILGKVNSKLIATEVNQSVLITGPTQSGKTSGLAIPAILEWQGPLIATSVKTDLIRDTYNLRRSLGEVFVYDPTGVSGLPRSSWSPLSFSLTWAGALAMAAGLCQQAKNSGGGMEDAGFWYATAEKLIAPLLYAAANTGATMEEVLRWIDIGEEEEPFKILESLGNNQAMRAAIASFSREERQKSSIYTTAETVLAAFSDPIVSGVSGRTDFTPEQFTSGKANTLYLVSPSHFQQRLQSVFVAIVKTIINGALEESARRSKALDPALLLVLDEAANIAPLDNLDSLASIAAGHGIQLLTIFQDISQVESRYGTRWATVVNNHRAKIICSSIADPKTLEHFSTIIGETDRDVASRSYDGAGNWTNSISQQSKRLAPMDYLRRIEPEHAVLIYGHLPPVLMRLRPFYKDRDLRQLSATEIGSVRPQSK